MLSQRVIDLVNRLLPGTSPTGAYALGMGCTACVKAGIEPTDHFLLTLTKSYSTEAAAAFIDDWIDQKQKLVALAKIASPEEAKVFIDDWLSQERGTCARPPESVGARIEPSLPSEVNPKRGTP